MPLTYYNEETELDHEDHIPFDHPFEWNQETAVGLTIYPTAYDDIPGYQPGRTIRTPAGHVRIVQGDRMLSTPMRVILDDLREGRYTIETADGRRFNSAIPEVDMYPHRGLRYVLMGEPRLVTDIWSNEDQTHLWVIDPNTGMGTAELELDIPFFDQWPEAIEVEPAE